jgi:hypothetical protein
MGPGLGPMGMMGLGQPFMPGVMITGAGLRPPGVYNPGRMHGRGAGGAMGGAPGRQPVGGMGMAGGPGALAGGPGSMLGMLPALMQLSAAGGMPNAAMLAGLAGGGAPSMVAMMQASVACGYRCALCCTGTA